jgi:hypothetical protein
VLAAEPAVSNSTSDAKMETATDTALEPYDPLGTAKVALGGATVALAALTGLTWWRERRTRRSGGS